MLTKQQEHLFHLTCKSGPLSIGKWKLELSDDLKLMLQKKIGQELSEAGFDI